MNKTGVVSAVSARASRERHFCFGPGVVEGGIQSCHHTIYYCIKFRFDMAWVYEIKTPWSPHLEPVYIFAMIKA